MKRKQFALVALSCVMALSFIGCTPKSDADNTEKQPATEVVGGTESIGGTEIQGSQEEVDYSSYNFADVRWVRDGDHDSEALRFWPDGRFNYSCGCGNPVNDSDVVESYVYDDATKTFTFICYEELEGMITEIKLISCDGEKLELDFDGEIRVFEKEEAE